MSEDRCYIFFVSNGPIDEAALIVPIYAASADEAWGMYYKQQGFKWQNVMMHDDFKQGKRVGTNDARVGRANDLRYSDNRIREQLRKDGE